MKIAQDQTADFVSKHNLIWYQNDTDQCFRVIPDGCVHEESTKDTYVDICDGYDLVPLEI